MTNKFCFGIDIGGTSIKAGLFEENGTLVDKYEIPTCKDDNGNRILDDIAGFVDNIITTRQINRDDIVGIGMGVPGSVMEDGTVNKCINLGWGVINPAQMLKVKTGFNILTGNDANMAALGEYWKGGACGYSSMMLITVGTGVGGGVIINGRPIVGYNGAAAELGHIPIAMKAYEDGILQSDDVCNCGKKGCLEQVASATGIVRVAHRMLEISHESSILRDASQLSAKIVFDAAKQGDGLAVKIAEYVCEYMGKALACASGIVDTECIIIGGGVSGAGQYLIDLIQKYYRLNVFHPGRDTRILLAQLGNEAGIYGAAKLILDN